MRHDRKTVKTMKNQLSAEAAQSEDQYLARLYRLQVRELEDYAFFIADLSGRIITWEQRGDRSFLWLSRKKSLLGQDLRLIFTEEDRASGIHNTEMTIAAKSGRSIDVRWHRRKDG